MRMNRWMRHSVCLLAMMVSAVSAMAQSNGFVIDAQGAFNVHGDVSVASCWTVGVHSGYHINLPLCFYVEPGVALEMGRHKEDYFGGDPSIGDNKMGILGIQAIGGVKLGKGWSFQTGPAMRVRLFSEDNGGLPERVNGEWRFGLNKDFGHVFVRAAYCQDMTREVLNCSYNKLMFGLGYRF